MADILLGADREHPDSRQRLENLVADSVSLIEQQVAGRRGFKGIGLKTGLAMAKAAKPGILPIAMRRLMPQFAEALEPLYMRFKQSAQSDFASFLIDHELEATAALLSVADNNIARSLTPTLKTVYARFRGGAEAEARAFLPAFAAFLGTRTDHR